MRINSEKAHLAITPDDAESLYRLAAAEAVVGRNEEALRDLRLAAAAGWLDYRSPQLDPRFDSVSEDTRVQGDSLTHHYASGRLEARAHLHSIRRSKPQMSKPHE